jgi:hypothetical protein
MLQVEMCGGDWQAVLDMSLARFWTSYAYLVKRGPRLRL